MKKPKSLSAKDAEKLLAIVKVRFEKNIHRHKGLQWNAFSAALEHAPEKIIALHEMEMTGGEPDVVGFDKDAGEFLIFDCSQESPKGRRSLCYDRQALEERKEFKPVSNVIDMANEIGIELLDEKQYRELQKLENFDMKTSSWIKTPDNIRKLGGALFADFRYNTVFVYHNGAQSYYAARGFRGCLRVAAK